MKIGYNSAAREDILQIAEYYELEADLSVAAEFIAEVDQYIDGIATRPRSFPIVFKNFRCASLRRFPFQILFRIVDETTIRVLVVRHSRRHPSYGTRRR